MALRFIKEIQGTRNSDDYATPKAFYDKINKEFNFTFDPCPLQSSFNGLIIDWVGNIFVNPPYSNIQPFIEKGINELKKEADVIVYLIPVRSDTKYWHDLVMNFSTEIRFVKGRLNFNDAKSPSPFPVCLIIFNKNFGNVVCSTYNK